MQAYNLRSLCGKIHDIIFITFQKAFRNFLEMACHCVVLDLFDEALFQTICYDPEKWLANLLKVIEFFNGAKFSIFAKLYHLDEAL